MGMLRDVTTLLAPCLVLVPTNPARRQRFVEFQYVDRGLLNEVTPGCMDAKYVQKFASTKHNAHLDAFGTRLFTVRTGSAERSTIRDRVNVPKHISNS